MGPSGNIPELALPESATATDADVVSSLEEAARLVQDFAQQGAPAALDALLAALSESPVTGARRARRIAECATRQVETLHREVEHFLSLTHKNAP